MLRRGAGGCQSLNLKISKEQEIEGRCAVVRFPPRIPVVTPALPGPGSDIRMKMVWTILTKTEKSGVWFFQNTVDLWESWVLPLHMGAVDWARKGSYHTAWSVPCGSSCSCSYAYGRGPAIGSHTGERCWPLHAGVWRAIAPMKPWCAEGDVPTAANLNLYRGWTSCVSWHSDDQPLFGKCGDAKLIVSVSFGSSALFRWRRQSCSDDGGHLCYLGHGDILVMDGQCQDEFLHCTDPGLEQERINVTFRWIKRHTASCALRTGGVCCLPTCAQGSPVSVTRNVGCSAFLALWVLLGVCENGGCLLFLSFPSWLVILGESSVVHKNAL